MPKQKELFATLRETLQSLGLQDEDLEKIVKEVTLLTTRPSSADEDLSSGSNSPKTERKVKYKTLHESKPKGGKKRELLVSSTLMYLITMIFISYISLIHLYALQ